MDAERDGGEPSAPRDALVVVDVQRDFLPGGPLAVPDGTAVIGPLNAWLATFAARGCTAVASRDWHPPDHCSFEGRGGPWPAHCVAGSDGAAFATGLRLPADSLVVSKGTEAGTEAYSAFSGTELAPRLAAAGVRRLWIGGLATDYCVLATVRDALAQGFEVIVLTDAVRGVDVVAGASARALDAMRSAGATLRAGGPPERAA